MTRAEQLRARILEAAASVLREQGPRTRLISTIAERAQVSRPTLYRYFPERADLYDSLIRIEAERIVDDLVARAQVTQSPLEDYVDVVVCIVQTARTHEGLQAVLKRHPDLMASHLPRILPISLEVALPRITPILEAGTAAGHWPAFDARVAVTWTVRLIMSFITMPLPEDQSEADLRRMVNSVLTIASTIRGTAQA